MPKKVWVALALFGFVQVGLLTAQVLIVEDQRTTTDAQLRTAVRQANAGIPLIEDAQPLVEQLANGAPQIKRLGVDAQQLAKELTPLAKDLNDVRADEQLRAAGSLARMLIEADVGSATRATRQLAVTLLEANVPRAISRLPRLADDVSNIAYELLRQQRLRRLLVRSNAVLGEIRARNTVEKATKAAEVTAAALPRTIELQEQLLATQNEALTLIRETRVAAERAARSAESIDRKTGGSAVPAAGTPTP